MRQPIEIEIKGRIHKLEIEKVEADTEYERYVIYGHDRQITVRYSHKRCTWDLVAGRMSNESLLEVMKAIEWYWKVF